METEYCEGCGLLHDEDDGDCLGCKMTSEIKKLKELLELARSEVEAFENFLVNINNDAAFLDSTTLLSMIEKRKRIKKEMEG